MEYSDAEELLIAAVEAGAVANFYDWSMSPSENAPYILEDPPERTIGAELIMQILRGAAIAPAKGAEARVLKISNSGMRLQGVTVKGDLNLEDLSTERGGPLTRLEFVNCWFTGKIDLTRCHLRSLAFRSCAFRVLQAAEAIVQGPVEISYARTSSRFTDEKPKNVEQHPEQCWVVLAGAQIGGRINVAQSHFRAPSKRPPEKWVLYSKHSRYALDLRGARIHGSVNMRPGVEAIGGVCLTQARVEGSIWANGANLTGVEESAFAADYASINGSIYMHAYECVEPGECESAEREECDGTSRSDRHPPPRVASAPFRSQGCVSLFAADIGGVLYMSGAQLRPRPRQQAEDGSVYDPSYDEVDGYLVDLEKAIIGGDCRLDCRGSKVPRRNDLQPAVYNFVADGLIGLASAVIRKDLVFNGAKVREVDARNIAVNGECKMSVYRAEGQGPHYCFTAVDAIHFNGGTIGGDFNLSGARIGRAGKGEIDLFALDPRAELIDPEQMSRMLEISAEGPEAGEDLYEGLQPEVGTGLFASGLKVGGNCNIRAFNNVEESGVKGVRFQCIGRILMREVTISNNLNMEGACLIGPRSRDRKTIDMAGIKVGGDACFMTWEPDDACEGLRFQLRGGDEGIRLAGAKIAQKLIMNGAQIRCDNIAVNAANIEVGGKASLGTHPSKIAGSETLYRFAMSGKVVITSATIKLGLDMTGALIRWDDKRAVDLLLLKAKFVDMRSLKDHRFEVFGNVSLENAEIDTWLKVHDARLRGRLKLDYAKIGTSVQLVNVWMKSGLREDAAPFGDGESARSRMVRMHIERKLFADLSLRAATIEGSLEVCNLMLMDPDERIPDSGQRVHLTADLRALHVGELQDDGGRGWGSDVRLWLDGFRYKRLPEIFLPRRQAVLWYDLRRWWDPSWIPDGMDAGGSSGRLENTGGTECPVKKDEAVAIESRVGGEESDNSAMWKYRADWLKLQYFDPADPGPNEYSPDAYEELARGFNASGSYEQARRVTSIKLTTEAKLRNRLMRFLWFVFRIFFDYGFSIRRAAITFLVCVAIGTVGVWIANYGVTLGDYSLFPGVGHVLKANVNAQEARFPSVKGREDEVVSPAPSSARPYNDVQERIIPCGDRVRTVLYALDLLIPVLDLRQQTACSVEPDAWGWRYAQASYAVLGWFLTPFVVLTFTGVLRRHLEK